MNRGAGRGGLAAVSIAVVATACQSDGGADRAPAEATSAASVPAACETSVRVTDQFGDTVTLTEGAGAMSGRARLLYRVWVGDHAVPVDQAASSDLTLAPGEHVLMLHVADEVDLTTKTVLRVGRGLPGVTAFAMVHGGSFGLHAPGARGSARVLAISDERLCLDVDYRSELLTVSGVVDAPVLDPSA